MKLFNSLDFAKNKALELVLDSRTSTTEWNTPVAGQIGYQGADHKVYYYSAGTSTWRELLTNTSAAVTNLPALDDTGDVDNPVTPNKLVILAGRVTDTHFSSVLTDALSLTKVGKGLTASLLITSTGSGGSGLVTQANFSVNNGSGDFEALGGKTFKAGRDPTAGMDVATKQYADALATGLKSFKAACRFISNANIANLAAVDLDFPDGCPFEITGPGTVSTAAASTTVTGVGTRFLRSYENGSVILILIGGLEEPATVTAVASDTSLTVAAAPSAVVNGVAYRMKPVAGDRVLVKDQTTLAQNGIYTIGTPSALNVAALTRAADADGNGIPVNDTLNGGTFVMVEEGFTYADTGWILASQGTVVIGTDPIEWVQFTGASSVAAGLGLYNVGNILHVGTASATRLVVNADNLDLADYTAFGGVIGAANKTRFSFDNYGRITAAGEITSSAGFVARTATDTFVGRTITGTTNRISVTNGDGVSGNPVLTAPQDLHTAALFAVSTLTVSGGSIALTHGTANIVTFGGGGIGGPTFTTRSAGTKLVIYPEVGPAATDYAIGLASTVLWFSVPNTGGTFSFYGGTTVAATLSGAGALTLVGGLTATTGTFSGGSIALTNATSIINFGIGSLAAPTFTTRSAGTKLVLYDAVGAAATDYALGVETGNLWFSTTTTATGFKFYGGTTLAATLSGVGALTLVGGLTATTGFLTKLDVSGTAGFGTTGLATAWAAIAANTTAVAGINFAMGGAVTTAPVAGHLEAAASALYFTPNVTSTTALDRKKVALIFTTRLVFGSAHVTGFSGVGASSTSVVVTHNLNTQSVIARLRKVSDHTMNELCDYAATTVNTLTLNTSTITPLVSDSYDVVIFG